MQPKQAFLLKTSYKSSHKGEKCFHPNFYKEYIKSGQTGDFICTACGNSYSPKDRELEMRNLDVVKQYLKNLKVSVVIEGKRASKKILAIFISSDNAEAFKKKHLNTNPTAAVQIAKYNLEDHKN